MQGDVILYYTTKRWHERLIAFATKGPYVHCGVLTGSLVLAAGPRGIDYELRDNLRGYTLVSLRQYATESSIAQGLEWAEEQVGKRYGWFDIWYQAVKFLNPNNPFRFGRRDQWDCSDFTARYLQHCGITLPDGWDDPYTLTPNDIGRLFGIVPLRDTGETVKLVKALTEKVE